MRYIRLDSLMNKRLSFRTMLTKMTFVMTSVAGLMLDSTCFVLGLPFGTFIPAHVLVKFHFKAFIALSRSSGIFCENRTLRFDRLASMLCLLDSQLYCGLFLCKQSTFSEINFFVF
jgi:hypothetical protein